MSDLKFDISPLKVKSNDTSGIYDYLLVFNSNICPNLAPLAGTDLQI